MTLVAVCSVTGAFDIDGDTFTMHLVNDSSETLRYRLCLDDCDSSPLEPEVGPGEDYQGNHTVGVLNWWQVEDIDGGILGCFRIFAEEHRPDIDTLYVSRDLMPCPWMP